ncbi:MupG family TIM beta-alpha barrel fold protein, partial [Selenomonas ruminantium]|uniref:MupG family TIM beta-alpha barrel fold protein n=1 Tax=Selenomonas ruminantium TaxID=971 RepID=UPI0026F1A13B
MENGISLYPGLDNTLEENLQLLSAAAACGIRRVFTSLHIPETDTAVLKRELAEILAAARKYDMEIISDISPRTLSMLDMPEFDLAAFQKLG